MIYTKPMSVTLKIDNYPSLNIKETSSLSLDVEPGATSITLLNNDNITDGDFVVFGRRDSETAELKTINSVSGATIVVTEPISFHHDAFGDVTALFGSQLKIYRADNANGTTPADGAFTQLGDPIDLDIDQAFTAFTDPDGGDAYWYKYVYFNPTTNEQTDLVYCFAVRGGTAGQYATIDDIRGAAGFSNNRNITDFYIDGFRRSAQDQVNGKLAGVYVVPFTAPINGFITQITRTLAAGHLKLDQYGQNNEEGQEMVQWAEDQLQAIRSGEYTLTDSAGNTLPKPGGGGGTIGGGMGMSGYPNNETQDDGFMFHRTRRY